MSENTTEIISKVLEAHAWLPHDFSRHGSKKPFRFIHFNMGVENAVKPNVTQITSTAEVV